MEKPFDIWNIEKKKINNLTFRYFIHTREVWWASIGINVGREEDGKNELFERPVLILKKFNNDVILAIPLSSKNKKGTYFTNFEYQGLYYTALISQIRLLSTKRLIRKIFKMESSTFEYIRNQVKEML